MRICFNCSTKVSDEAKFCQNCGVLIDTNSNNDKSGRKIVYDGIMHKCPNCGEVLEAFVSNCPSCGYELRNINNSKALSEFAEKLVRAEDIKKKADIIRNFPIPNTREDILEFMILATSNIEEDVSNHISDAWRSKIEQIYQKACIIFTSESEFARINTLYIKAIEKLKIEKRRTKVKNTKKAVVELMPVMPNIFLILGWFVSILILIAFSKFNLYYSQLLLLIDLIAGAVLIPLVLKKSSDILRLITVCGLILSVVTVGLNNNNKLILMVDIICSVVILIRMFRMSVVIQGDHKIKQFSIIFTLCSLLFLVAVYVISSINATNIQQEKDRQREEEYSVKYEWPSIGLSTYLPKPDTIYGKIDTDDESRFSMELYKVSKKDFENYVQACKEKGFEINITKTDSGFYSYNLDEHKLDVFYDGEDELMTLYLDAPMKMVKIEWPKNSLVKKLPKPNSTIGNIQNNDSEYFSVYLDDVTEEEFNEYVDKCIDKGFDEDYSRSDSRYSAYNWRGYSIVIEKKIFDQMYIKIETPKDEE